MGFMPFGFLDKAYESVRNAALGLMPGTATTNTNGSRLPTQPLSSSLTTVLIFVAPDVDSICCLKMLVALLKSDCILYRIVPVSGYTGLGDANDTLIIGNTALKSIIMINAGGMVDLAEFLTLEEGVTVYVLDAHRPLNLQNIFGSSQIMVLDDGDISDMKDLRKAFEELEFDGDNSSDDDSDTTVQATNDPTSQYQGDKTLQQPNDSSDDDGNDNQRNRADDPVDINSSQDKSNHNESDDEGDGRIEIQDSTSVSTTLARDRSRKRKSDTMIAALSLGPSKRVRQHEKRRLRREYQRQIAEYYAGGTYHGMAASGLMYTITSQLGRSNSNHLWYGIIGLTDYYIHNKVSLVKYVELIKSFQEEVNLVSIREGKSGGASMAGGIAGGDASSSLQDVFGIEYDDDDLFGERPLENNATSLAMTSTMGSGRSADDYSINYHEDFRLMLLKHWTMYDSMFHSEYVATKLGMWRSKGRQRLTNLLVKMGFPQKESRQNYVEMSLPFKKRIKPKLQDLAPRFNMPDLLFPSFYRNFGHSVPLSATDVVYALSALVDCGATTLATDAGCSSASGYEARLGVSVSLSADQTRRKYGSGTRVGDTGDIMSGQGQGNAGDMGDQGLIGGGMGTRSNAGSIALRVLADSEYAGDGGDDQPGWMRNFYTAYDALDSVHWLHHGILLAIHIQRILVRTGMMLLDKKSVQTLQKFQMVSLMSLAGDGVSNSGSNGIGAVSDITVFGSSVMVLHRLMGFLMDAFAEHRKSSKRLPFVLVACLDKDASHCLVIGRSETQHVGEAHKNPFGLAFQSAAERIGVELKHDSFEASAVYVEKDDLSSFLENLQMAL
ncbi:hypothetical protein BASA50_000685 [Batrachochytrium salamandrivorans]|uniref:CDC45-like protein n=1 Tax=Batrachochytrium salamandrivorans TaxID=1357716 RepID=A0ABQ8ETB3_9FUNG|nr:hypothetical protein BASA50_000685 [Batrachochytrium salamandrivorans]